MVKVLSFSFEQCFGQFTILLIEGLPKRDTCDIYLTTCFGVRKFKNTAAMGDIVFLKMFKIESKFTKCKKKNEAKIVRF